MSRPPDINPVVVIFWTAFGLAAGCVLLTAYLASIWWLCREVIRWIL